MNDNVGNIYLIYFYIPGTQNHAQHTVKNNNNKIKYIKCWYPLCLSQRTFIFIVTSEQDYSP